MEFHCSGRTWTWLVAETSDPGIREALAEENLTRKEHIGSGFQAYFSLTRPEAEKTLALLEELEALRAHPASCHQAASGWTVSSSSTLSPTSASASTERRQHRAAGR